MSGEMRPETPLISVVVPVRNAESTIAQAIRSCLDSQWVGEVVIVNDGSTDGTDARVAELADERIRVIDGPGCGISAALNTGFAACQFPLIARCDADDWVEQGRFAWQVPELADPSIVAISGAFTTVDSKGMIVAELANSGERRDVTDLLRAGKTVTHLCTWLIRRDALQQCGGAREWFQTAEDIDLQFRLASVGRIVHVPRFAYRYRLHDQSITHTQGTLQRKFYEQTARDFAIERASSGSDALDRGSAPKCPDAPSSPHSASKNIARQLVGRAWQSHRQGKRWIAIKTMLRAAQHDPTAGLDLTRQIAIMLLRRPADRSGQSPSDAPPQSRSQSKL